MESVREKLSPKVMNLTLRKPRSFFLMGIIHRFPDQWLILGIVYPPKPPPNRAEQLGLTLGR